MSWFNVDDGFYDHPKTLLLMERYPHLAMPAIGLWTLAASWCSRYRTGGIIPRFKVCHLAPKCDLRGLVDPLVEVGFWYLDENNVLFRDWDEWNKHQTKQSTKGLRDLRNTDSAPSSGGAEPNGLFDPSRAPQTKPNQAKPSQAKKRARTKPPEDDPLAVAVLDALNAARKSVIPSARLLRNSPSNRARVYIPVEKCDATLEEWLDVINQAADEVRRNPSAEKWFTLVSLSRPDNFSRKLEMAGTSTQSSGRYEPVAGDDYPIGEIQL